MESSKCIRHSEKNVQNPPKSFWKDLLAAYEQGQAEILKTLQLNHAEAIKASNKTFEAYEKVDSKLQWLCNHLDGFQNTIPGLVSGQKGIRHIDSLPRIVQNDSQDSQNSEGHVQNDQHNGQIGSQNAQNTEADVQNCESSPPNDLSSGQNGFQDSQNSEENIQNAGESSQNDSEDIPNSDRIIVIQPELWQEVVVDDIHSEHVVFDENFEGISQNVAKIANPEIIVQNSMKFDLIIGDKAHMSKPLVAKLELTAMLGGLECPSYEELEGSQNSDALFCGVQNQEVHAENEIGTKLGVKHAWPPPTVHGLSQLFSYL